MPEQKPINTDGIELPAEIVSLGEKLAENVPGLDRDTAIEVLKTIHAMGFRIVPEFYREYTQED